MTLDEAKDYYLNQNKDEVYIHKFHPDRKILGFGRILKFNSDNTFLIEISAIKYGGFEKNLKPEQFQLPNKQLVGKNTIQNVMDELDNKPYIPLHIKWKNIRKAKKLKK